MVADLRHNVNWLKLKAAQLMLHQFQDSLVNQQVLLLTDNITTKAHVNHRGHTFEGLMDRSTMAQCLGGETSSLYCGRTHLWVGQPPGRLAQASHRGPRGVAASPQIVSSDLTAFRHPSSGLIRNPRECPAPSILLTFPDSRSRRHRRPSQQMAKQTPLRLPPSLSFWGP